MKSFSSRGPSVCLSVRLSVTRFSQDWIFKFGSLVFLEIAYKDSLQQCIASSRGEIDRKLWGPYLAKEAKIGLETGYFAIVSSSVQ